MKKQTRLFLFSLFQNTGKIPALPFFFLDFRSVQPSARYCPIKRIAHFGPLFFCETIPTLCAKLKADHLSKKENPMLLELIQNAQSAETPIENQIFENESLLLSDFCRLDFNRVLFRKCKFLQCDFSKASLLHTRFEGCDLSGSDFSESFWKYGGMAESKFDGCNFSEARIRECKIAESLFYYANFPQIIWENCEVSQSFFSGASFHAARFKDLRLQKVNFSDADFFGVSMKKLDLSDCDLTNISISDTFQELRGVKLNAIQAAAFMRFFGVEIV